MEPQQSITPEQVIKKLQFARCFSIAILLPLLIVLLAMFLTLLAFAIIIPLKYSVAANRYLCSSMELDVNRYCTRQASTNTTVFHEELFNDKVARTAYICYGVAWAAVSIFYLLYVLLIGLAIYLAPTKKDALEVEWTQILVTRERLKTFLLIIMIAPLCMVFMLGTILICMLYVASDGNGDFGSCGSNIACSNLGYCACFGCYPQSLEKDKQNQEKSEC
jgi:hypothetical protein